MKCDQVQTLHGPYLDSELNTKTTLAVQRHLKTCPACARVFVEEEKLEARIMAGLNRGPRTVALWERIERSVVAPSESSRRRQSAHSFHSEDSADCRRRLLNRVWAGWQAARWAWTGLAAVWVVILALNLVAREPDTQLVAGQEVPSASEMRFALKQKQLLMAELAITSEPNPAGKSKAVSPGPRSDRRSETLNT